MPKGVILIAEDYKDNRDILKDIVAEEFPNIKVQAVEDGARAAEVIKEQIREIRLLLTDLLMPELNGDAVIQVLKDEAQKAGIPVPPFLVLSATPENVPTDLQPYLLPKPFNLSNLLTRIRKALQPQETHLNTTPTLL